MAFDVVSVKLNKMTERPRDNIGLGPGDTNTYSPHGGLFSATHEPLLVYIMFAYKIISINDISNIPGWVRDEHFDIEARAAGNPTKDQLRLMMQSVLVDRFKLTMRIERQVGPVYWLVLSKPGKLGPQLERYSDDGSCSVTAAASAPASPSDASAGAGTASRPQLPHLFGDFWLPPPSAPARIRVAGKDVPMALVARQLPSGTLSGVNWPVFDHTGLTGNFNFSIEWTPRIPEEAPEFVTDNPGPTFLEALRDQLGFKLVPRKSAADVFVIDHIEEPTPN